MLGIAEIGFHYPRQATSPPQDSGELTALPDAIETILLDFLLLQQLVQ